MLKRPEAKRNGAYFLLGDDEEAVGGVRCYIGRTENFINRFRDHSAKKEFWDRVVLVTAKDDSFTEGHWGYLEWRLVELAKQAAAADREIERESGMALSEIFEMFGQHTFRRLERAALEKVLAEHPRFVVATGGNATTHALGAVEPGQQRG